MVLILHLAFQHGRQMLEKKKETKTLLGVHAPESHCQAAPFNMEIGNFLRSQNALSSPSL